MEPLIAVCLERYLVICKVYGKKAKERVYSRKDNNSCISGRLKAIVHSCEFTHGCSIYLIEHFLEGTTCLVLKSSTKEKYDSLHSKNKKSKILESYCFLDTLFC